MSLNREAFLRPAEVPVELVAQLVEHGNLGCLWPRLKFKIIPYFKFDF